MKNNKNNKNIEVIKSLNIILRNELVAINQYFIHAKILQDQGYTKLAAIAKAESIDEMKHADQIMERILFLKGSPKMTDYTNFSVGEKPVEMINCDYNLEILAIKDLKDAIKVALEHNDIGTKEILEAILVSEEQHFDFLETQLSLIEDVGLQNYLATQI